MSDRDQVRDDLSIEEAAVALGMAPTAVIRLLESGQLASHLGADGRRRRIVSADLEAHRDERFALRQQLVQEQRTRRWAEPQDPAPATGPRPGPDATPAAEATQESSDSVRTLDFSP